jgi:hypothetical protein
MASTSPSLSTLKVVTYKKATKDNPIYTAVVVTLVHDNRDPVVRFEGLDAISMTQALDNLLSRMQDLVLSAFNGGKISRGLHMVGK